MGASESVDGARGQRVFVDIKQEETKSERASTVV
jgi:hypothetical protein